MVGILQRGWGMSERPLGGISAKDWAATPLVMRALQGQVTRMEQRVQVRGEQVRQSSSQIGM